MQKILREPIFHFLLIGGSLFFLYSFLNPAQERLDNNVIRIDDSDVQRLIRGYEQSWNSPPDSATLKNLIAEEIKSEVFYREAVRMQLDHNDEIIRRRLKQKYEFLVKDLADSQEPAESELKEYYDLNKANYKESSKLSFSHIYFSPDKRKDPLKDATTLLSKISSESERDYKEHSDPFHLQYYFDALDRDAVRQLFGSDFSKTIFKNKEQGWLDPIRSGYGIHLVKITSIKEEEFTPYEMINEKVLSDWKSNQQQLYNEQLYKNLLQEYEVEYALEN